jgi:hypothetical protein
MRRVSDQAVVDVLGFMIEGDVDGHGEEGLWLTARGGVGVSIVGFCG